MGEKRAGRRISIANADAERRSVRTHASRGARALQRELTVEGADAAEFTEREGAGQEERIIAL
jgi:hypothetical protein